MGGWVFLPEDPTPLPSPPPPRQLPRARPSPAAQSRPLNPSNPTPWPAPATDPGLRVANSCFQSLRREPRALLAPPQPGWSRGTRKQWPARRRLSHCFQLTVPAAPPPRPDTSRSLPQARRQKCLVRGPGNQRRLWHPEGQTGDPSQPRSQDTWVLGPCFGGSPAERPGVVRESLILSFLICS